MEIPEGAIKKKTSDHALALIKAGVEAVPIIGGPIASLIGDYVPTATQRAIESTIQHFKQRIEVLESRIDPESINKDEFAELFKSCYLIMIRSQKEEKLVAVANLMSNILLKEGDPDKLEYTELDHFVRCLDALSIGAIKVLACVFKQARLRDKSKFGNENVRLDFGNIHSCMNAMSPDLLMGLLEELNTYHLVHLTGAPTARTPNYANYPLELPPIGVRFSTYILGLT